MAHLELIDLLKMSSRGYFVCESLLSRSFGVAGHGGKCEQRLCALLFGVIGVVVNGASRSGGYPQNHLFKWDSKFQTIFFVGVPKSYILGGFLKWRVRQNGWFLVHLEHPIYQWMITGG